MKKRCTNSACRRVFRADSVCPYCGKQYPRVSSKHYSSYEIELLKVGQNKIYVIKAIRNLFGFGLKEANRYVDSAPCILGRVPSFDGAKQACGRMSRFGAKFNIRGKQTSPSCRSAYEVVLVNAGRDEVRVTGIVSDYTLSFDAAQEKVKSAPCVIRDYLTRDSAQFLFRRLHEAGARAEMKQIC